MHAVLVYMVGAGGYGDKWVNPDIACSAMQPSYRTPAIERLVRNKRMLLIGGVAQVTPEGLLALEIAS